MLLTPGEEFARLHVTGRLGGGRLGEVYAVRNAAGAPGAVRVLHPRVARGVAEAAESLWRLGATLPHPHLVGVRAHGIDLGTGEPAWPPLTWCLSDLYPDGTAARLVPSVGERPDLDRALGVLDQVAQALAHLHAAGVVHGDVTPTAVLLDADGPLRAALGDLGSARLVDLGYPPARHGRRAESLPYASPELLRGDRLTPAADLYGLACLATALVTGAPPFTGASGLAVAHRHLCVAPPSWRSRTPWLPPTVEEPVRRALAKDPDVRGDDVRGFVSRLAEALGRPAQLPSHAR